MFGMSSADVLCLLVQVAVHAALAEKDVCIAHCQAWHGTDVQNLRARNTAMLADIQDRHQARLAAALEQQRADMEADVRVKQQRLETQYKLHVRLLRKAKQADLDQVQSNLNNAQAEVDRLHQVLHIKHCEAEQARLDLQSQVCSRLHHLAQQEALP